MPPTQAQYDQTNTAVLALQASVATDKGNQESVDEATAQLASATSAKNASGSDVQSKLTAVIDAALADGFSVAPSLPVKTPSVPDTANSTGQ